MKNPLEVFDLPTFIKTERLELRFLHRGMVQDINNALMASSDALKPRFEWMHPTPSLGDTTDYVTNMALEQYHRLSFHVGIYIKGTNEFVGMVSLNKLDPAVPAFTMGYWCDTAQAGNGYMSEAVLKMAEFAMIDLKANRVELSPDVTNVASIAIAEKLVANFGYEKLGEIKNCWRSPHNNRLCNCVRYVFTQNEELILFRND